MLLFGCVQVCICPSNACVFVFLESALSVIHSNNNSPIKDIKIYGKNVGNKIT